MRSYDRNTVTRKRTALNALADIRDYLRKNDTEGELPSGLAEKFNFIATTLGADPDWCKE